VGQIIFRNVVDKENRLLYLLNKCGLSKFVFSLLIKHFCKAREWKESINRETPFCGFFYWVALLASDLLDKNKSSQRL